MLSYVKGVLVSVSPLYIVVEAGNIGYKIFIPPSLFSHLPPKESHILLHTSFVVREVSQTLYGFLKEDERDLFEGLMGVSGIGPKLALSLIGHLGPLNLQKAIHQGDICTISKVPGIGKKTSERLIVELRDKIQSFFSPDSLTVTEAFQIDPKAELIQDAMNALIHLGYNQMAAQKAIKTSLKQTSNKAVDLASLITASLQNIIR